MAYFGIRPLDGLDGAEVLLQAGNQFLLFNDLGGGLSEADLQLRTAPCGERKMRPSEKSGAQGSSVPSRRPPRLKA